MLVDIKQIWVNLDQESEIPSGLDNNGQYFFYTPYPVPGSLNTLQNQLMTLYQKPMT